MKKVKQEISSIAASLIIEDGLSYYEAKTKAQKLMINKNGLKINKRNLPTNMELERAIKEYSMLFFREQYTKRLEELRKKAKKLIELIGVFDSLVIGSIAKETVTQFSDIRVCCFTDSTKEIAIFLLNKGIDTDSCFLKHPLRGIQVEALRLVWEKESTIIYAFMHLESKLKLRGLSYKDLCRLVY